MAFSGREDAEEQSSAAVAGDPAPVVHADAAAPAAATSQVSAVEASAVAASAELEPVSPVDSETMPAVAVDPAQAAPPIDRPLTELISDVERSVVRIEGVTAEALITGTGFVHRGSGKIVTNHHVIEGVTKAFCEFPDGRRVAVTRVDAADADRDFAVLTVDADLSALGLTIADSLPAKGSRVIACGNPKGFSFTVSEGIVSGVRTAKEVRAVTGEKSSGTWVQTSAPISEGNSGGPLMASDGTVVGMNTWVLASGQNLNFALSCVDLGDALRIASGQPGKTLEEFAAEVRKTSRGGPSRPEFADLPFAKERRAAARLTFPSMASWLTRADQAEEKVLSLKRELEAATRSGNKDEQAALERQVRAAVKKCEKLRKEQVFRDALNPRALRSGEIGSLTATVIVVQVLDRTRGAMLANVGRNLAERNLICVRGVDLSSVEDGGVYSLPGLEIYYVAGTMTYETVSGGTNTVSEVVNLGKREEILTSLLEPEALTVEPVDAD